MSFRNENQPLSNQNVCFMDIEQLIKYIRKNLEEKKNSLPIDIKATVLFGSWAKGTATPDSDVDLLAVADDINPKRHRRGAEVAQIKRCLPGLTLDVLLHTKEEVISNFIKMCQNTPQLCWGDEWPPLSPGGRGLGLRLGRAYGSER